MKTILKLLAFIAAAIGVYAAVIYFIDSAGRRRDDRRHIARLKKKAVEEVPEFADGIADYRDEDDEDESEQEQSEPTGETSSADKRAERIRDAVSRVTQRTEQAAGRAAEKVAEKAGRFAEKMAENAKADEAPAAATEPSEDALEQMLDE